MTRSHVALPRGLLSSVTRKVFAITLAFCHVSVDGLAPDASRVHVMDELVLFVPPPLVRFAVSAVVRFAYFNELTEFRVSGGDVVSLYVDVARHVAEV